MATLRERFLARLAGTDAAAALFVPDLSSWYQAHRINVTGGEAQKYGPGELIPDDDPMHKLPGTMPAKYRHLTHIGLHRFLNVPIPVHNYHWLETRLDGVGHTSERRGNERIETWATRHGTLTRRWKLAVDDGSWATVEFPARGAEDLAAVVEIELARREAVREGQVEALAREIGDAGFQDIVINRSPLGRLVHEYLGMERFVYALYDYREEVEAALGAIEEKSLETVRLAAGTTARVVILGDNIDENLLAPPVFEEYALPFYRKAAGILHARGKYFSCHMDGNIKRLLPILARSGLDIFDGCTPEPMNNYTPEDLRDALGEGMHAFCGIPSTFFAQGLADEVILDYARRIIDVLGEKAILNVGDILPINGDIEQVARVAEMVAGLG
jgi:hypothetical protein